jgi:hypothetical protein
MIERGREWGGPRYAAIVGEPTAWRRLGRRRHGPDGGGGGTASRQAHGVDPTTVEDANKEASTWTRWRSGRRPTRHRCGLDSSGGGGQRGVDVDSTTVEAVRRAEDVIMPITTVIFLFEVNRFKNITNVVIFLFEVNGFKNIYIPNG